MPERPLTIPKSQARRFLLAYHHLLPPRLLVGKEGILEYIQRVGCIQFDPVEAVGRNPELVLQARIQSYSPTLLEELLYKDRSLIDGWDKLASIHLTADWPHFDRHRSRVREHQVYPGGRAPVQVLDTVLQEVAKRGPLSSLDLDRLGYIDWHWGPPARLEKAALDTLYAMGLIGVHHRTGSRRYYDLMERLLPQSIHSAPDPHASLEDYLEWHVLRRIGSLGLANNAGVEHWLGILDLKARPRGEILARLENNGLVTRVAVEELPGKAYSVRTCDLPLLEESASLSIVPLQAAFLGPLDNLLWDRDRLRQLFDFDYVWEVYKPAAIRKYGYYTLPVLAGERFVARFSPTFVRKTRTLQISGWWWEDGVQPDSEQQAALVAAIRDFQRYLCAERVEWTGDLASRNDLGFLFNG